MKKGHIEVMKRLKLVEIIRLGGMDTIPFLEKDEVVVFRRFFKARLRFPLHKMVGEVLEKYEIYLHHLTPNAKMKLGGLYLGCLEPRHGAQCRKRFAINLIPYIKVKVI
jgi:hypothetical protein